MVIIAILDHKHWMIDLRMKKAALWDIMPCGFAAYKNGLYQACTICCSHSG
jgi:hypothetical protein